MRIAVFIKSTTFHKGFGGLETQNKSLCEGLVARGHTVFVFAPKKELTFENKSENGVSYSFVESDFRALLSGVNKNSWVNKSAIAFENLHKDQPFDIVLSQSSAGLGVIRRKNEFGVKVIAISHGTALGELSTYFKSVTSLKGAVLAVKNIQYALRQYFGRQREFILHSNKVIAVSSYVKKHIIEETFIPEDKICVINNGVATEPFKTAISYTANAIGLKVLYLSQVTKEKGADFLPQIALAPELKDSAIDVLGDGAYFNELKNIVETQKINNINLLGKLSHDDVIKSLCSGNYDIFIFPTKRAEGFPMVLPEAMLASLPVVAFDCGGVSDAVKEGVTGFLIKPELISDFIQKMIWFKHNVNERLKMGENAKITAMKEFSLSTMLDKYEDSMREVLK